jgi:hypothetical protein
MAISVEGLYALCSSNLVELRFVRRNKRVNPNTRRMLCTNDQSLFKSVFGKEILNYRKPTGRPPYNAKAKNLCTLWDILLQDWRNVPTESVEVVSVVPTKPFKQFLLYFDKIIRPMSAKQKEQFMKK